MILNAGPGSGKIAVSHTGLKWDVELGSRRHSFSSLVRKPGAWIKRAAVLMNVGEDQIGIVFIRIIDAVTVMNVDIHVCHACDSVFAAQRVDHQTDVVEHAKSRGILPSRVMEAANG